VVLDSSAITKIHSVILVVIIVIAAVAGSLAYIILSGQEQGETIKIGVLADLDAFDGKNIWQGAVLAAEQLNAEGGILGKQVEVVGEDTDISSGADPIQIKSVLTRLLTYHKVDFIVGQAADQGFMAQEVIAEHKTIFFEVATTEDSYTQRVVDDYDAYKYFFRVAFNATSIFQGITDALLLLREQTGFNKVGYIGEDLSWAKGIMQGLDYVLPELYGFDLVYKGAFPLGTFDFSSYFATAETAGVEIMVPLIALDGAIPFVKEYGDRQSPMVIYGGWLGSGLTDPEGWEITGGKCKYISVSSFPVVAGYPTTSKTIPDREAYINRWVESPTNFAANAYDVLRYILPDAIEIAGTIETEAVIEALETTSIETTNARDFVFTSSHDLMMGENPNNPEADYTLAMLFQWIDGEQVPVYPEKIMEEAGVTYTYPDWPGPWDK
jgi:branched-chain amino acid transport system substrate-binding protein